MQMEKLFTPLSLVQGDPFRTLVSDLDPCINQVIWNLVHSKLITDKAESLEFQVKYWLNNCGAVVLTYDLWMS